MITARQIIAAELENLAQAFEGSTMHPDNADGWQGLWTGEQVASALRARIENYPAVSPADFAMVLARWNSRDAMLLQDELPDEWRMLVYKHGQQKVFGLIARGMNAHDARRLLTSKGPVDVKG